MKTAEEEIKRLHKWSLSKIKRLNPTGKNKGWMEIHLLILIKEAFRLGRKFPNKPTAIKQNKYIYSPPIYFVGQKVRYEYHNGSAFIGKIGWIETHYDHLNRAYHIYSIARIDKKIDNRPRFRGFHRWNYCHIGERKILEVVE